jgi:hypothetical protein
MTIVRKFLLVVSLALGVLPWGAARADGPDARAWAIGARGALQRTSFNAGSSYKPRYSFAIGASSWWATTRSRMAGSSSRER